jgi:hypothetical protein
MTAEQVFRIIRVSSYWTEALPKDLLRKKLHEAVATARAMIGERNSGLENLT